MIPRQFEIWKAKPQGFEQPHWFVLISGNERCAREQFNAVNGLACFTLRGIPLNADVRLNSADGFERPTVCGCDYFPPIPKSSLQEKLGAVSWERQQEIKFRIKQTLRL